jgi:hypothetical protein
MQTIFKYTHILEIDNSVDRDESSWGFSDSYQIYPGRGQFDKASKSGLSCFKNCAGKVPDAAFLVKGQSVVSMAMTVVPREGLTPFVIYTEDLTVHGSVLSAITSQE